MNQLEAIEMQDAAVSNLKPSIFLYGPSGSGKSTAGRILAESLDLPFVDLDQQIKAQSGMRIPEIFAREGESGFRRRETQALKEALTPGEVVLALGGGALTTPANRQLAETCGRVVVLNAPLETLLSRLQADTEERPLISGDARARLKGLLAQRRAHYASFPLQLGTDGKTPQAVAWALQVQFGSYHLRGMASAKYPGYDVRVVTGGLDQFGAMLRARGLRDPVVVVTDENVGAAYLARTLESLARAGYPSGEAILPAGEAQKTVSTVSRLWEAYLDNRIERSSTVIALGGGVVGDLAGFAAATFLRGVPWVAVPTSLLAMVDASMGGKTGVDLAKGKNLVGAFHPPRFVLADPGLLMTLPEAELRNGMVEVLKHGVIGDPELYKVCKDLPESPGLAAFEEIVRRAMAVKVKIIEEDPFEKGARAALNLGHTVGHGIELASGFGLRHGEAVAIGMVIEARMAEHVGLASPGLAGELANALRNLGLPVEIPAGIARDSILAAMKRDKKVAGGEVRFALPAGVGDVRTGIVVGDWERWIQDS